MTIEDTSKRDPFTHLIGIVSDGQSDYITGMEAAGQQQLVNSTALPIDCRNREAFEALGFVFGDPVDDLFVNVTLPTGWSKKGSDHAMWSHVVDERGLNRVAVFYKAAFYDRRATMHLVNPGMEAASGWIYSATEPDLSVLTADEVDAFAEEMRRYLADVERHPGIYGTSGRGDRAQAGLEKVLTR